VSHEYGPAEAVSVPWLHEQGRAVVLAHVGKPAHPGQHERLAERQRGLEDPGLVDLPVRQRDDVGAPEEGGDLVVAHEARDEADPSPGPVGPRLELLEPQVREADDPELGALDLVEGVDQHVEALVRAQQAEEQDHRALHGLELLRERPLVRKPRQVVERTMRDHVHALRRRVELRAQAARPVLRVHDDGVHRAKQAPECRHLAAPRLPWRHVVGREDERLSRRKQVDVDSREREPLVVDDVGLGRVAAIAQHLRDVLCQLHAAPDRPGGPALRLPSVQPRRLAVEGLRKRVLRR
jgi:hypothetical protein